jgi:group I intron endonuclease
MNKDRAFILYLVEAPNGKRYVGITSRSVADRWFEHLQESRAQRANRAISNAIRKYGASTFGIAELDRATDWRDLCSKERDAIARFNTFAPAGYNLTRGGDGFTGRHSPETIVKMRAAHSGKVRSAEHCQNLSAALKGRRHPPEVIAKILNTKRGKPLSDAQRRGLASMHAQNVGRVPTIEHRQKIGDANRGRPNLKLRGRPLSSERRAKIGAANAGRIVSAGHRAKLRAAWVLRRARNRQSISQQELI